MPSRVDNSSLAPDALRNLSDEQTERLTAALDEYLARLESGDSPNLSELLAKNADIAEPLQLYIVKLGELHNFAAGFSPHLAGVDEDEQQSSDTFEPVAPPKPLISPELVSELADDTSAAADGSTVPPTQAASAVANDSAQSVPTKVLTAISILMPAWRCGSWATLNCYA